MRVDGTMGDACFVVRLARVARWMIDKTQKKRWWWGEVSMGGAEEGRRVTRGGDSRMFVVQKAKRGGMEKGQEDTIGAKAKRKISTRKDERAGARKKSKGEKRDV